MDDETEGDEMSDENEVPKVTQEKWVLAIRDPWVTAGPAMTFSSKADAVNASMLLPADQRSNYTTVRAAE